MTNDSLVFVTGSNPDLYSTVSFLYHDVFQVLTGIFGVGAKTAERWIREGIHSLPQLQDSAHTLNRAQQAGVCVDAHVFIHIVFHLVSPQSYILSSLRSGAL